MKAQQQYITALPTGLSDPCTATWGNLSTYI